MVVGEPPVAVNLDEVGEQTLDDVLETGPVRMTRDLHALPRRERPVQVAANRLDASLERLDLPIARVGARQHRQRVDLLQEHGDRLLEFQGF